VRVYTLAKQAQGMKAATEYILMCVCVCVCVCLCVCTGEQNMRE